MLGAFKLVSITQMLNQKTYTEWAQYIRDVQISIHYN